MGKKKILVVDDEKFFTELLKSNLELAGQFEVRVENNAVKAASSAREFNPDIILLDILMPGISGYKVSDELKNDELTRDIPVIFLTALATTEKTADKEVMVDNHPFIAKPISINELIKNIDKYARK